jgi:RHS repeat-associated protein
MEQFIVEIAAESSPPTTRRATSPPGTARASSTTPSAWSRSASTRAATIRDLDGKVLRDYRSGVGGWSVERDYVHADGKLLAAVRPSPFEIHHYHLDHLGTPRLITNRLAGQVAYHAYFPYGEEATWWNQDTEAMKFTGHERDFYDSGPGDDLDYQHARYYNPLPGRYLSLDPVMGEVRRPQSWNRYSYALANPLKWIDPTGEKVSLSKLKPEQQEELLGKLNEFTGNTYGIDDSQNLILLDIGAESSKTATSFLNDAIGLEHVYSVEATAGRNQGTPGGPVEINFSSFADVRYRKVDSATFNLGSTFVHELYHSVKGIEDWSGYPGGVINQSDLSWRGPVVDFVNQIREERGLPQRAGYLTQKGIARRSKFPFNNVNAKKPEKIYYVRRARPWD